MKKTGQSVAEYALLVVAITAAFVGMRFLIQRSTGSNVEVLENQVLVKSLHTPCNPDPCAANACRPQDCVPPCDDIDPCAANACHPELCNPCDPNPCAPNACRPQDCIDCSTDPCHYNETDPTLCASECAACRQSCVDKVDTACTNSCDSAALGICNSTVYSQCTSEGRSACGYSNASTACCNSCPGACLSPQTKQMRQGNFMLAGGISANTTGNRGYLRLAADDAPRPGDPRYCYNNCMASVNNCVTNYASSCRYSCTGITISNGVTLTGCSGNDSQRSDLLNCLNDTYIEAGYGGACGVMPPTARACCIQRCTYGLVYIGIDRLEICYMDDCGYSWSWAVNH